VSKECGHEKICKGENPLKGKIALGKKWLIQYYGRSKGASRQRRIDKREGRRKHVVSKKTPGKGADRREADGEKKRKDAAWDRASLKIVREESRERFWRRQKKRVGRGFRVGEL